MLVRLWADGGCRNSAPAGGHVKKTDPSAYTYLIQFGNSPHLVMNKQAYHGKTNSQMELSGVLLGLAFLLGGLQPSVVQKINVQVISDSRYVVNAFNRNWISAWENRRFANVKNAKLWKTLIEFVSLFPHIKFKWVRGHQDDKKDLYHQGNCICDHLLNYAMDHKECYVTMASIRRKFLKRYKNKISN